MAESHQYRKGERVRWSTEGARRFPRRDTTRIGTVATEAENQRLIAIQWDGSNRIHRLHRDFIEPMPHTV